MKLLNLVICWAFVLFSLAGFGQILGKPVIQGFVNYAIPMEIYQTNTAKDRVAFHLNGTQLNVPAKSVVDSVNKDISGNVQLYLSQALGCNVLINEMFPKLPVKGKINLVEIKIKQNNRTGFVKDGSTLSLSFLTDSIYEHSTVYFLENKQWKEVGKAICEPSVMTNGFSEAYNEYPFAIPYGFDSTSFEDRFKSLKYFRTKPVNEPYGKSELEQNFTIKPVTGNEGELCFEIKDMNYEVYPEMENFKGLVWVITDKITAETFKNDYLKNKIYHDIRLKYDATTKSFEIALKSTESVKEFNGYARYPNTKIDIGISQKLYDLRCPQYTIDLEKAREKFDKTLEHENLRFRKTFKKQEDVAMRNLRKKFSEAEKLMSDDEWKRYHHSMKPTRLKKCVFEIKKAGVYLIINN